MQPSSRVGLENPYRPDYITPAKGMMHGEPLLMDGDWRNAENGFVIPTENYTDQPYVVKTDDGAWLCCVTTGSGREGEPGQHVLTLRSCDQGRSWCDAAKVEPDCPFENSYAVMLKAPGGRVFIFYNHNTDNIREALSTGGRRPVKRVDSLGHFVFRYSDDHGRSWSPRRYDIPLRRFRCDRENVYGGRICFFWNVGRAFIRDGGVYVTLNKLGDARFEHSEGVLLHSPDLLTVADPALASWETLPDGDDGLRTPLDGGDIAEEHNIAVLSDGSFYDTYRTMDGLTVEAVSRDRGHTWSAPRWMCRANGRLMKNPRAANFVWRCANGKYLYWFHNHGGKPFIDFASMWGDRNPVWICPGVETDTPEGRSIRWGEPELLLYHRDASKMMSYPDLVEESGRYFFTETEKRIARVHEVPAAFLEKLWASLDREVAPDARVVFEASGGAKCAPVKLPDLAAGGGFSLEFALEKSVPQVIFDSRGADGRGMVVEYTSEHRILLGIDDSRQEWRAVSERVGELSRAVIAVDGGPGIVSFVADGVFLDGGDEREFGWRRFNPATRSFHSTAGWRIGGNVAALRIWDAALLSCEAVALTRRKS